MNTVTEPVLDILAEERHDIGHLATWEGAAEHRALCSAWIAVVAAPNAPLCDECTLLAALVPEGGLVR